MEAKTTEKFPFQEELIQLLQKEISLHSVYVIGFVTEESKHRTFLVQLSETFDKSVIYTLLLIGHKAPTKDLGNLSETLFEKMKGRCRVYPIFYTLSTLLKRMDIGDNFLNHILFDAPCIFRENDIADKFSPKGLCLHSSFYDKIEMEWKVRMERADYFLSTSGTFGMKQDDASRLAVMGNAMEQVCIGLLYIFWEYEPNHYCLTYLFHLVSNFTQLPQKIFPRTSYDLQRQFYMLCNAQNIIRFKVKNEFSSRDSDKVLYRCKKFYEEAGNLGIVQLEHLKKIHGVH